MNILYFSCLSDVKHKNGNTWCDHKLTLEVNPDIIEERKGSKIKFKLFSAIDVYRIRSKGSHSCDNWGRLQYVNL